MNNPQPHAKELIDAAHAVNPGMGKALEEVAQFCETPKVFESEGVDLDPYKGIKERMKALEAKLKQQQK